MSPRRRRARRRRGFSLASTGYAAWVIPTAGADCRSRLMVTGLCSSVKNADVLPENSAHRLFLGMRQDVGERWKLSGNPDWIMQRQRVLALLEQQARLERMVRIVGRDALPPEQQLALVCADLVNEAVLRQSAMSVVDRYCSPARQGAILKGVVRFLDLAEAALAAGAGPEQVAALPCYRRLQRIGEEVGENQMAQFAALERDVEAEFEDLSRGSDPGRRAAN